MGYQLCVILLTKFILSYQKLSKNLFPFAAEQKDWQYSQYSIF